MFRTSCLRYVYQPNLLLLLVVAPLPTLAALKQKRVSRKQLSIPTKAHPQASQHHQAPVKQKHKKDIALPADQHIAKKKREDIEKHKKEQHTHKTSSIKSDTTAEQEPKKAEDIDGQIIEKAFIAEGDYQVTFTKVENQWIARIQSPSWSYYTVSHQVPVYLALNMKLAHLLKMDERSQKRHIHILFQRDTKNNRKVLKGVYIGIMGLNGGGNFPLHEAVNQGDLQCIKQLINASIRDIKDDTGNTAVHILINSYKPKIAEQQLKILHFITMFGPRPNMQDNDGNTPLHLAVKKGHIEIVKKLLERSADIYIQNNDGNTPLHLAVIQNEIEITRLLLASLDDIAFNTKNNLGKTLMHYAAAAGHVEIVKILLAQREKKKEKLGLKVLWRHEEISIQIQDEQGYTPLHGAAENGHSEIISLLLQAEADPYIKDKSGITALHKVFNTGQTKAIQAILKQANLFPLRWAVENGDTNLVKQLIAAGSSINSLERYDKHALYIAFEKGYDEIAKQLLEAGANINSQIIFRNSEQELELIPLLGLSIARGNSKVANQLLKAGADINYRDNEGRTCLHLAVKNNQLEIFQALLDAGANVNAKDNFGNSPLHIAANNSHWYFVTLLLEARANLQATDDNGYTALDNAMAKGRLQLVEVLSAANIHKFYASCCAARARKQLTFPQRADSEKENISTARIQKFLDDYTASLLSADKEKFNADITPILHKQLGQAASNLQEQVIHYFQQGGDFHLQVLQKHNVQDWVKESLILDIIQATSDQANTIAIYQLRTSIVKLLQNYSDIDANNLLYILQEIQATHQLELSQLCEVITYLSASNPSQAVECLTTPHENWIIALQFSWLNEKIKSLKHFLPKQRRKLTHTLNQLLWQSEVTATFLNGLQAEKSWRRIKQFFSFITLNTVPEDILISIFNLPPLKEGASMVESWQYYIISKCIKSLLKKIFPAPIPVIESQIDILLLDKLWLLDVMFHPLKELSRRQTNYTEIDDHRFSQVLDLLIEYNLGEDKASVYGEVLEVITDKPSQDWEKEAHKFITKAAFKQSHERSIDEILSYITEKSPYASFAKQKDHLETAYKGVKNAYKESSNLLLTHKKTINKWNQEEILEWANHIKYTNSIDFSLPETQHELIAVIKRAVELCYGYPPRNTQLLTALIMLNPAEGKGRLAQVNTGEGKSLIVAILAAIHGLQCKKVDIVTTSTELSVREAAKQENFFSMLGLTVGENSNDELNYGIYGRDIVYGTAANFQRDILLTEFSGKDNRGRRGFGVVIVDKVDSMLFDSRNYNLHISSQMPAMHHLEVVLGALFSFVNLLLRHLVEKDGKTYYIAEDFEVKGDQLIVYSGSDKPVQLEDKEVEDKESFIVQNTENWLRTVLRNPADTGNGEETEWQDYNKWCAKLVMFKYKLGREQKEEKKKQLEERIKTLEQQIENAPWKKREEVIDIPKHLRGFVLKQIPHWTRSALLAICFYKKELHYDIKDGEIVPIDYDNTGVLQESMVWNDGLAQMLQIKEGLKVKPESISTNYISTPGFFKRYGHSIYGLTGTLGNQPTHDFLSEVYSTGLVIIPPYKHIQIANNEHSQYLCKELPAIIVPTHQAWREAISKTVLSKVRNKRAVLVICKYIDQAKRLAKYLRQHHNADKIFTYTGQEKFTKEHIDSGEVIIATNIAGRGTDLTTTSTVEEHGGMHVCITFLPDTYRIELQNAGRTARQGKKGTAQLIIQNADINDIKLLRTIRDWQERNAINRAKQDVEEMDFQDRLFDSFCALESKLLPNVDDAKKLQQYQIIEEAWEKTEKDFLSPPSIAKAYQAQLNARVQADLDHLINKLEEDISKTPETQWGQLEFSLTLNNGKKLKITDIKTRADIQQLKENLAQFIRKDLSSTLFKEDDFTQQHTETIRNNFYQAFKSSMAADVIEALREGKPFIPENGELAAKYKWGEQEKRAIQERWGIWLHHALKGKRSDKKGIQDQFTALSKEIKDHGKEDKLIQNPYFYVLKGNELLAQDRKYLAIEAYDKAIYLDHLYSVNARYNKAWALLKEEGDSRQNIRIARKTLQQAKILLASKHQSDLILFHSLVSGAIGAKPTFLQHMQYQINILAEQQNILMRLYISSILLKRKSGI